jgi:predicted nucleic acid-binding protein
MLYAESSAVLAWLLGEDAGASVREALASADIIISSDLTLIECDRVLIRATVLGDLTEAQAADRRAHLNGAAAGWQIMRVGQEIVERARRPFPGEPLRTLDAVHLASALVARQAIAGLELLSLDDRIRGAGRQLGIRIQPSHP